MSVMLLFNSCNDSATEPQIPTINLPLLNSNNYKDIILKLVDYDVVQITHKAGLDLQSKNINQIEFGKKEGNTFHEIVTFPLYYDTTTSTYLLRFKFTISLDQTLILSPLTVRYQSNNHTYTDVDTIIELYKYPYSSAEIFADNELIYPDSYQDIAHNETKFFFHGWNSDGLHEYDLITHQKTFYNFYYGGSHITANSNYVFCDINHKQVVRFNLNKLIPDLTLPYFKDIIDIDGLAINDSSLLVLVLGKYHDYLKSFNMDGIQVDSIAYPHEDLYFMAAADSIIYRKYYLYDPDDIQISRFDLRSRSYLPNVLSPAKELKGMDIYNDTLYYCDFWKDFVGRIPIDDLIPVQ